MEESVLVNPLEPGPKRILPVETPPVVVVDVAVKVYLVTSNTLVASIERLLLMLNEPYIKTVVPLPPPLLMDTPYKSFELVIAM